MLFIVRLKACGPICLICPDVTMCRAGVSLGDRNGREHLQGVLRSGAGQALGVGNTRSSPFVAPGSPPPPADRMDASSGALVCQPAITSKEALHFQSGRHCIKDAPALQMCCSASIAAASSASNAW